MTDKDTKEKADTNTPFIESAGFKVLIVFGVIGIIALGIFFLVLLRHALFYFCNLKFNCNNQQS